MAARLQVFRAEDGVGKIWICCGCCCLLEGEEDSRHWDSTSYRYDGVCNFTRMLAAGIDFLPNCQAAKDRLAEAYARSKTSHIQSRGKMIF